MRHAATYGAASTSSMKLEVSEYPIPQIIVLLAEVRYHFVSYQVAISRKRKAKGIVISNALPGLEMPAA